MLGLDSWLLLTFGAGLMIGHFSLLYLPSTKEFTARFKKFRNAFEKWLDSERVKLRDELRKQLKDGEPEQWRKNIEEWTKEADLVKKLTSEYNSINKSAQLALILFAAGLAVAVAGILWPGGVVVGPFDYSDLSFAFIVLAIFTVAYYLMKYQTLIRRIANYELGTPVSEFARQELAKEDQEQVS